jgi:hypothetical protein
MHSYLLPCQISILVSVTMARGHAYLPVTRPISMFNPDTRARGHAVLPVTRPNIHPCLCYQGQRSYILTCYQAKYPSLTLLPGPEVMHSYLLPGQNIHSCLCYQGQRSCILTCYQAKYPSLSLLPGPEVMHSYLLPGQNIHSCLCNQGQRSCILTCYQAKYPCLSLLLGPQVMHTYLLPGQISMLIPDTRARGHAFLPVTWPNIHPCLCYQGQRSCILTCYQAKYPILSLLP